ncbi:hypothetical protein [Streptomyces mirabilis]|uniref:hypothetical protein n=1 Tax=Streptomyces mirabilis TaxID=68239 RepID=UPI0033E0AC68
MTETSTPDDVVATLTRAYELLEDERSAKRFGALSEPLADLIGHHLGADRHGPIPTPTAEPDPNLDEVFGRPGSSACYSCGDTGVRYDGVGADGHQWSGEQCCCQHSHCGCGACGGYPCEEVQYLLAVATAVLQGSTVLPLVPAQSSALS